MFCRKCGTQIADDAAFCFKCGEKTDEVVSAPAMQFEREPIKKQIEPIESQPVKHSYGERLHCPSCKSTDLKSEVLHNPGRVYWVCPKCHARLRDLNEVAAKIEAARTKLRLWTTTAITLSVVLPLSMLMTTLIISMFDFGSEGLALMSPYLLFIGALLTLLWVIRFLKSKKLKELEAEEYLSLSNWYED